MSASLPTFYSALPSSAVPGMSVPWRTTAPRVVSGLDTITTPAGLAGVRARVSSYPLDSSTSFGDSTFSPCVYEPYVHIDTGERAMIPMHLDPHTGVRHELTPAPNGFVHAGLVAQPAPTMSPMGKGGFFSSFLRC